MTDVLEPCLDVPAPDGVVVVSAGTGADAYNPAQQELIDLLGKRPADDRQFDAGLRLELRAELEHGIAPLLDIVAAGPTPDAPLFISKYPLAQIHGCETKFVAERAEDFAWSVAVARGTVSHKAIELSIYWPGEPTPLELVDEAIARLTMGNGSIADFLQRIPSVDLAELRGQANERVAKFLECFPPLKKQWRPVTESAVKVELFDQRVILQGRVDLTLGSPRGTTAGKVLIDLKSGGYAPTHADDLRFYALVETIRLGTPPRMLATYYLDTGRAHPEAVTEGLLLSAVHRTIDGARRIVELEHGGDDARMRAGPACRWCPRRGSCAEGDAWLRRREDGDLTDAF